jgi:broad specificity phosphatase PhoE
MIPPRQLILVKHAPPQQIPEVTPRDWQLSEAGRARCKPLAERLTPYQPSVIFTSLEPKAIETGRLAAEALGVTHTPVENLHEHDRSNTAYDASVEAFEAKVARFFATPDQLVYGTETADAAHARFAQAVTRIVSENPSGNLVIVAHGAVITLFVSRRNPIEPFSLWKRLGLPSFVVLDLPSYTLHEIVARV